MNGEAVFAVPPPSVFLAYLGFDYIWHKIGYASIVVSINPNKFYLRDFGQHIYIR